MNLPFYGDTLFIGARGSGKTLLLVRLAAEDSGDKILTNFPIDEDKMNAWLTAKKLAPKKIEMIEHPRDFYGKTCAYRLLDEAQKYFAARRYKDVDDTALAAIYESRKDDAAMGMTTQMLRTVDVITAGFADQIVRVTRLKAPIIGWIWPKCVRKSIWCKFCGKLRRDGIGDAEQGGLLGWMGWGTYFKLEKIDPEKIVKTRTVDGSAMTENETDTSVVWTKYALYDQTLADCYDSGQKIEMCCTKSTEKKKQKTEDVFQLNF